MTKKYSIGDDQIQRQLLPFGVQADEDLCRSIRSYVSFLLRWNEKISLTALTDTDEILRFHFGESFFAAQVVPIQHGRLADVGSGAGFPGLALRLVVPSLRVTLIEAQAKKIAFLKEVSRGLALDRVEFFHGRMEEFPQEPQLFDYIAVRALGQHDKLLAWSREHLEPHGKLVLWLGREDLEKISRKKGWQWDQAHHIPGSERRFLLSGSISS